MHRAASPSLGAATTLAMLVLVSATGGPFGDRDGGRGADAGPRASHAPAFPARGAVARARRYLAHRDGFGVVRADRLPGTAVRLRPEAAVRVGEREQGDDAGGLPAQHRAPPPERRGEGRARADDHALRQRARRHGVPLGRRCRAAQPGRTRGHEVLLGVRVLGLRPDHGRGPGPLLPADRPAGAEAQPGLRGPPALLDRGLAAMGVLPARATSRLQDLHEGRVAQHRRRPPGARGRPVPARVHEVLHGGAHRR